MSDAMLFGVLRMPYELAMCTDLSRRQFHDRAQQAVDELERMRKDCSDAGNALAEVEMENERQSNNVAILAQQVADLTAELANERAHQFRALHEPDTCNGSMGAGGYVPDCVALRDELQREHEDHQGTIADASLYLSEAERLRAERDALRADAERYRWLRDAPIYSAPHGSLCELWLFSRPTATAAAFDAAIDEDIAKKTAQRTQSHRGT